MVVFSFGKAAAGALLVLSGVKLVQNLPVAALLGVLDVGLGAFLLWTCVSEHNTPNFGG